MQKKYDLQNSGDFFFPIDHKTVVLSTFKLTVEVDQTQIKTNLKHRI